MSKKKTKEKHFTKKNKQLMPSQKNKPYHEAKTLTLAKVGLAKLGLAKVGCMRMAEVGWAKVGFDRWCVGVVVRGRAWFGVWCVRGVCVCTFVLLVIKLVVCCDDDLATLSQRTFTSVTDVSELPPGVLSKGGLVRALRCSEIH